MASSIFRPDIPADFPLIKPNSAHHFYVCNSHGGCGVRYYGLARRESYWINLFQQTTSGIKDNMGFEVHSAPATLASVGVQHFTHSYAVVYRADHCPNTCFHHHWALRPPTAICQARARPRHSRQLICADSFKARATPAATTARALGTTFFATGSHGYDACAIATTAAGNSHSYGSACLLRLPLSLRPTPASDGFASRGCWSTLFHTHIQHAGLTTATATWTAAASATINADNDGNKRAGWYIDGNYASTPLSQREQLRRGILLRLFVDATTNVKSIQPRPIHP